jgi:hypothetical protein
MCVAIEPIAEARRRILDSGLDVLSVRRLSPP